MINVICGYSGAGKTTYAIKNKNKNDVIIDADNLKECFQKYNNQNLIKELQLIITQFYLSRGINVWYITCFPSWEELELFVQYDSQFVWINTTLEKSLKNIYLRNRNNDLEEIEKIKEFNLRVSEKYCSSKLNFKIVDIFERDERW